MCGAAPRDPYAKSWDPVFSTHREIHENWSRPYVDQKRTLGSAWDGIELFFRDTDGDIDCKVEELVRFVGSFSPKDLKAGSGSVRQRRGAWLDERSRRCNRCIIPGLWEGCNRCLTPEAREYKNPLTATELYERLRTPRIGDENQPDADRRLIYIEALDPAYMLVLAETAVFHEVQLLRDALWQHLAGRTSLKVRIPTKGYRIFQLEFHLRYFTSRHWAPSDETGKEANPSDNPRNKWIDLSFLEVQTPKAPDGRKPGMFEAHFSLVICGSDESRWVAYALDNTELYSDELYDRIFPCEGVHQDPIGSCLNNNEIDADRPIWNPRAYFLLAVANRITRAADEWDALLWDIERKIKEYRDRHPSTLSHLDSRKRDRGETVQTFDWTRQTIELMNQLLKTLSETIKFWKDFNDTNGDVGYFSNFTDMDSSIDFQNRTHEALCNINETFQTLERLQRNLESLSVQCKDSENALKLRLTLESNEATKESSEATKSSGATTDFTTFVLVPIMLAAACLQYSPGLMPLPPGVSVVVLTAVFIVTVKLLQWLHVLSGGLPGISWWWKIIKGPLKTMKLENGERWFSVWALSRFVRKHRSDIDRKALDVEMGPVRS